MEAIKKCSDSSSRFAILTEHTSVPLLRNNGYEIGVNLYAQDTPSKEYKLKINAKDKVEVFVKS